MPQIVAAIHQPNFFPWLGYFSKLAAADVFVFLDAVNFPKSSWVNRVKVRIGGEARWITCPVERSTMRATIAEVDIHDDTTWRRKLIASLESNYARASHFDEVWPGLRERFDSKERNLASFNINVIQSIARELNLATRLVRQSELEEARVRNTRGSERLASICHAVNANVYLAGDGAAAYEDESVYAANNIAFRRLGFVHPTYPQGREDESFLPGLSILDALFHVGWRGVRELLDRSAATADNQTAS